MKVFNLLIGKLVHYTVDFNEKYIPFWLIVFSERRPHFKPLIW